MQLFPNSITINSARNTSSKKTGGFMFLSAILATALTACPQPPTPEQPVQTRALTSSRDVMLHGIVAGTTFNANQSLSLNNASVFANAGLVVNSRNLSLNGNVISSTSAATCTDNSGQNLCVNGKPKYVSALVSVPKPDYAALKTKYNATPTTTIQNSLTLNSSNEISAKFDNQIVLVKGSINLNAIGTIKNAVLIVNETFKSNKGLTLENTRIIAKEAQFNQTSSLTNSRILTDEDLTFNGKLESNGLSSVITNKNFTSNGTGLTSSSGELAVIANQNITLNQVSSGKVILWAGSNITVNQNSTLEGAMVAGGKVVLNSSVSLTRISSHLNPDVLGGGQLPYGTREEGVLRDGGTWTSSFGVSITAPVGSLRKPEIKVFVEIVDPAKLEKPLPDGWELADQGVYRIGVVGGTSTKKGLIQIRLPLQNPNLNRDLFVFRLSPGTFKTDGGSDELDWGGSGSYDLQDEISITSRNGIFLEEGLLYAVVKRKIQQRTARISPTVSNVGFSVKCAKDEKAPTNCDESQFSSLSNFLEIEYANIDRIMNMDGGLAIEKVAYLSDKGLCRTSNAYFDDDIDTTFICVNSQGAVVANSIQETIRHELFHGFQWTFLDNSLYTRSSRYNAEWSWILESTATTSVKSEIESMDVYINTTFPIRKVTQHLLSKENNYEYQVQDFWVHSGKYKKFGLRALKPLFESGLLEPMTDLDNFFKATDFSDGVNKGIRAAYWLWTKNQAYEKTIKLRPTDSTCFISAARPDSTDNIATYSLATTPKLEWTALANALPEKGVAPLETRVLKVSLTDRDNLKSFKQLSLKVTNPGGTPLDKQKIRYKWYSDPNPKDKPTCGVGEDTEVDTKNIIKYTPIKNTENLYLLISNVSIDKATSANRINLEDVKVTIEPADATMLATSSTGGSSINLSGTVGSSTNTEQLKISNTGDFDSTLEFKQYFSSTNIIDASLLNPNSPVVAAAKPLQTRAVKVPPSIEGSLFVANGFNPSSSSEDVLTKTEENPEPSSFIDVNYYCSSAGGFDANVNVVYKTGTVDENGVEILELTVVPVTATCTSNLKPKISDISGGGKVKILFGEIGFVPVTFSNIGDAPLDYSVTNSSSGTLSPGESITVQVRHVCGYIPGDYFFTVYITSNDLVNPVKTIVTPAHCYGDIVVYDSSIVVGGIYNGLPSGDVTGLLNGPGCFQQSYKEVGLGFPSISTGSGFLNEIAISHDSAKFPSGKYSTLVRVEPDFESQKTVTGFLKSTTTYATGYEVEIFKVLRPADPGFGSCEHFSAPNELYYAELSTFVSEVDAALETWKASVSTNPSINITNVRKITNTPQYFSYPTSSLTYNGNTLNCISSGTICIYADVKFSFQ
jgi:hypothetical protein